MGSVEVILLSRGFICQRPHGGIWTWRPWAKPLILPDTLDLTWDDWFNSDEIKQSFPHEWHYIQLSFHPPRPKNEPYEAKLRFFFSELWPFLIVLRIYSSSWTWNTSLTSLRVFDGEPTQNNNTSSWEKFPRNCSLLSAGTVWIGLIGTNQTQMLPFPGRTTHSWNQQRTCLWDPMLFSLLRDLKSQENIKLSCSRVQLSPFRMRSDWIVLIVHPWMKRLSSFTHLHVIPNPCDIISSVEQKEDILKNVLILLSIQWKIMGSKTTL